MSGADDLMPDALAVTIATAEAAGLEVVKASGNTLLLDLDTDAAYEQYLRVLPTVEQYFGVVVGEEWRSKGGNRHVRLRFVNEYEPYVRYALQAALGSDGVKEVLTLIRERNGCEAASILFKPAQAPEPAF